MNTTIVHQLDKERKVKEVKFCDLIEGKKVIIFGLPGAFTPTCSKSHLPMFEQMYDEFKEMGIDEIYCHSVNDAYVMDAWFKQLSIEKVKYIADGNGYLAESLQTDRDRENLGFGIRTLRYASIWIDGKRKIFATEADSTEERPDPYLVSRADAFKTMIIASGVLNNETI